MKRTFAVASIALAGCSTIAGIGDYVIGACKGGTCAPEAGIDDRVDAGPTPADDSGVPCSGRAAPEAVRIGSPGNTFCIDRTEVTRAQYGAFLAANVPTSGQPSTCAWNESFAADPSDGGSDEPVTGIDWCDAVAYCAWAGKYLCGVVENGRKVGPVTPERAADFRSHQWLLACSAEARKRYPYGGVYTPGACNLEDRDAGRPLPVGSSPGCVGGYEGIVDMIGNVWEWYDIACRSDGSLEVDGGDGGPASDNCSLKGGSFFDRGETTDCSHDAPNIRRDFHGTNVGFRCCSD